MLSNVYFLAKFRFDTAENEPAKNYILQNLLILLTPDAGHRLPGDAGEELEPAAGSARTPAPRGEEELREERREGIAWLKRLFDV